MKRYAMFVDVDKCTQCHACTLACKDEHFGNDFLPITYGIQELGEHWITMHIEERGSGDKVRAICWPELCRHCDDPACAKTSGGAVYQREDGIVLIHPEQVPGDRLLPDACPFHAISWNEEKNIPQKCTFCAHLLDVGESVPRCVEACPTGALLFGDLNDPGSGVSALLAEHPELKAQTGAVRYFNLPGQFISGSVYLSDAEAAINAQVCLTKNGTAVAETRTNGFGDFRFENLPEGTRYELEIRYDGFAPLVLTANTKKDVCFEELTLRR